MINNTLKNSCLFLFVFLSILSAAFKVNASAVISKQKEMQRSFSEKHVNQNKRPIRKKRETSSRKIQLSKPIAVRYEEETISFDALWEELKITSEAWPLILDPRPKEIILSRYIALYGRQGIIIKKPPSFYIEKIDMFSKNNTAILKNPFKDVLKFIAIMEYDFDNGKDKDEMAKMVLGQKLYEENKIRLGK